MDTHFNFHFANAYDDPVTGEVGQDEEAHGGRRDGGDGRLKGGVCGGWSQVVFDTVRVPKLFLTDNQGRDGKPVWEVVDYEREVSRQAGRYRQQ